MSSSGGCGCGGSSGAVATKGGCGCDSSMTGEGFTRPRFFGGMLLTEDDLQAAVDYSVAKRKLTNRNVIGAGVVCGLEVTCHPCDAGKVNVATGYAIDCCGNDILVSCAEEVDVLALVRDLRQRTGVDCGEACDDQPLQSYHLYVRYVEAPTAPVAPYASDDCATGECEFSRIREGYRFDLRCDPPDAATTLIDALERCEDRSVAAEAKTMTGVVALAAKFADLAAGGSPPAEVSDPPTGAEFNALNVDDPPLDVGLDVLKRSTLALALDASATKEGGKNAPGVLPSATRKLLLDRAPKLAAALRRSPQFLALTSPEEIEPVERILTAAERPPNPDLGPSDRAWLAEGTSALEAERAFVIGAEKIRGRILRELAGSGQSRCDDYRKVSGLRFDGLTTASKDDAVALGQAYLRSVAACTCAVVHPPCPDCTDEAVALAKVRVDACDVVEVCALERRWVLSPRALGYWFPIVEIVRELLERACCPDTGATEAAIDTTADSLAAARAAGERALSAFNLPGGQPEVRELLTAIAVPAPAEGSAAEASFDTSAALAAASGEGPTLSALDTRIEELGKRLDDLANATVRAEGSR